MDEQVVARSWTELTELLFEGAWSEPLRRFRSHYAFRGKSAVAHHLETALSRLGANAAAIEGHLLRNFRKYAFGTIPGDDLLGHATPRERAREAGAQGADRSIARGE